MITSSGARVCLLHCSATTTNEPTGHDIAAITTPAAPSTAGNAAAAASAAATSKGFPSTLSWRSLTLLSDHLDLAGWRKLAAILAEVRRQLVMDLMMYLLLVWLQHISMHLSV